MNYLDIIEFMDKNHYSQIMITRWIDGKRTLDLKHSHDESQDHTILFDPDSTKSLATRRITH